MGALLQDGLADGTVGRNITLTFFYFERTGVVYNCCWPSPAQSFSGPSSLGLATTFYCLRFKSSIFVAFYDSQGYGGGIRRHLHTGDALKLV
jgi:hypothetical protein